MMDDMVDNRETPPSVGERRVSNEESSREYGVVQYLSGTQLITVRAASQNTSSVLVSEMPVSGIGQQVDHCFNNPPSRTPLPIPTTTSNIGPITAQDSDSGAAVVEHNLSTRRQTRNSAQLARNVAAAAATTSQTNEDGSSIQKKEEFKHVQPSQTHTTKTGVEFIQEEGKVTRNATLSSTAATSASKRNLDASVLDSEDGSLPLAQGPKCKTQLDTVKAKSDCTQTEMEPAQKTTEASVKERVITQSTIQAKKPVKEGRQEKKRRSQLQMLQAANTAIAYPKIVSGRKTWNSMSSDAGEADDNANRKGK